MVWLLYFLLVVPAAFGQQGGAGTRVRVAEPDGLQTAESRPAEGQAAERGKIAGQVLNAATSEPLRKANLILRRAEPAANSMNLPPTYTTVSDAGGKFAMKDIEPGKYRLSVNRTGFVAGEYGSRGPSRPGGTLALAPGQRIEDLVIRLTPQAVITGRVLDEDGEPVANAQVQPLRYRYVNGGRKQLMPYGGATTNDLGEYRIFGLAPGRYYLSATYRPAMMFEPAVDRSANQQPEEGYVPTYYPGAIDPGRAVAVEAAAGAQLRGIDFSLSKTRTVRVRGRVTGLPRAGRAPGSIMLLPRERLGAFFMAGRPTRADAQGNFEVRGVAPGAYMLVANCSDGEKILTARQPVDVGNADIDNVALAVAAPIEMTGHVRVEGEKPVTLSDLHIALRARDPDQMNFGPSSDGRVKADGSFTLSNVNPGHFSVMVFGQTEGYFVRSVRMGDEDVLDSGLDVTSGSGGPIAIVLSPGAGQVEGTVIDAQQQPAQSATVVLAPKDGRRRAEMWYYKTTTTDQYGRFTLKNLDPGDYKLFAWEEIESGAYMDPDFMKPVEEKGESITLRKDTKESVQLKVIPAEGAQR